MARIFLDMDNTLADFSITTPEPLALERMYSPGYFLNLAPINGGAEMVSHLMADGHEVFILSACIESPYCRTEKSVWLSRNFPMIPKENHIFTTVGQKKTDYVNAKGAMLLDDYGKNLRQWREAGGMACRFDATQKKSGSDIVYRLVEFLDYVNGRV